MSFKSTAIITAATVAFAGYCVKVAVRPVELPSHPYPPYVLSSQLSRNPAKHASSLNRLIIISPISPSTSNSPTPTAQDLTRAMFSSWVMLPERMALNTFNIKPPLQINPITLGEKLLEIFHVDRADEECVELSWKAFGMTGTHFLRREIRKNPHALNPNADASADAAVEIAWKFDTVVWSPDNPVQAPLASLTGRVLSVFHDVYARMLISCAVSKLGY